MEVTKLYVNYMTIAKRELSSSDTMDLSTKQSVLTAAFFDVLELEDDDESSRAVFDRWYGEIGLWFAFKFDDKSTAEKSFPVKRDDRIIALTCYAAHMSVELVMEELCHSSSSTYRYKGAERTIKSLHVAVLTCFDLICKNLLIEKTWAAVNIKHSIIKAADLATQYLNLQADKTHFLPEDEHDYNVLWLLQGCLTGNFEHREIFSERKPSTKILDDDLVGVSCDFMKIKERLQGLELKLDIIPIVGMGGIGKTTLTRGVYKDPEIKRHFHVHAWIIVSQEFRERDVLLGLLESIAPLPDEVYKEDKEDLARRLYQRLKGWRYFVVIDDIWTREAWDHLKFCFPDDNNASRIILTSRISEVASYVNPENPPHFVNFLGLEDSWDLLQKLVFGKESCPPQLVNIGMQIAQKCQGLPLAIEVVAGHLSKSKNQKFWEDAAERVGLPTEVTQMESLSSILSLSYNDLPLHLKACFLTMTIFPKNSDISVRKLIQLWTAMGFLPQKLAKNVEEVAMKCLLDLIGRSLISVRKKKFDGKVKLCGVHDLLWDLGMREARKEGHYIFGSNSSCNFDHINSCDDRKYAMGISRTLLYLNQAFESDYLLTSEAFKPLRVLDILNQSFDHFPIEITSLVNLRYLALATCDNIPGLVSTFSNLETLLNYHEKAGQMLPKEIWLLARLRHLHIGTCTYLVEPQGIGFEGSGAFLPNLQSLSNLSSTSCTEKVFLNMQNLKKLGIKEIGKDDDIDDKLLCNSLNSLVHLHQLEILKLLCNLEAEKPRRIPDWCSFLPNTIKQLTLVGSNLPWNETKYLSMLGNLEVLKLKESSFKGDEWEMDDEEFSELKFLLMESLDLISWKASTDNFPKLRCLVIRSCYTLCSIPIEFGEITTLELIDLEPCFLAACHSARKIKRMQIDGGNDNFMLRVGLAMPLGSILGLFTTFVWLSLRLKTFKPQRGTPKKKLALKKLSLSFSSF